MALKTGYVTPYHETRERMQVIVVVREDWTVSCYDANLNLLWERAVAHKAHEIDTMIDKFRIDEVAVMIAPVSVKEGSLGLVVVGASMTLRDVDVPRDVHLEHEEEHLGSGDEEHPDMHARASLEHFSVYALDAASGHVLWLHDGLEIRPEEFVKSLPMNAIKLDRRDLQPQIHHAPGISDWTIFRQSLMGQLPHGWRTARDASLKMAHFERRHMGARSATTGRSPAGSTSGKKGAAGAGTGAGASGGPRASGASGGSSDKAAKRRPGHLLSGGGRFTGVETPPLSNSAILPHDASEHTDHPNVLVAHTKNGLEVIALKTGVPMTSLALTRGSTYADVDGDGVVDSILVLEKMEDVQTHGYAFAHEGGEIQHCSLMVVSGLPAQSQLFNGSICANRHSLNDPLSNGRGRSLGRSRLPDEIEATSPAILRTLDPKTLSESKLRDIVIAVNTGLVTCYSGTGAFKWQLKSAPTWDIGLENFASSLPFDADSMRVDDLGTEDSVHAHVLVMGDSSLSLISRDGAFLTSAEIPARPVGYPVIGDFDSDGVTDVIIVTEDSILGFRLEVFASSRGLLIALILLASIAFIVFIANIRIDTTAVDPKHPSAGKRRQVLSLARSTEESLKLD